MKNQAKLSEAVVISNIKLTLDSNRLQNNGADIDVS